MAVKSKKGLTYYLVYGVLYLHALLPFRVLYVLSDILYVLIYHLAKYRKKTVRKNLLNSFPNKDREEIIRIEKAFYRHLCDYFVESIKTLRISDKEVKERMKFLNTDILDRWYEDGRSCILCLGHCANWEWVTSIGLHLKTKPLLGLIYKQLHNAATDQLFLKIRHHFGATPIEMKSALRKMIKWDQEGVQMIVGFLADQRPGRSQDKYWTTFLNQDTPVHTGMGKIAVHLQLPVAYLDISKVKRGYYEGRIDIISYPGDGAVAKDITERYVRKLEKSVLREPAYYLWSHNRWKFKREGGGA